VGKIQTGFLYNRWYLGIEPEHGRALAEEGKALCVGTCHRVLGLAGDDPVYVRQHTARTLEDAIQGIKKYRDIAAKYGLSIFFRGQNRDYLLDECLNVTPAAARKKDWSQAYALLGKTFIDEKFRLWNEVIQQELKVEPETGIYYWFSDPDQPTKTVAAPFSDRRDSARISTNPLMMAIAMHYGFPTLCLDVSADEAVSIWFALHQADRDANGAISFSPLVHKVEREPLDSLPSLYIYLQKHDRENPVVELTRIEQLRGVADRPFMQSAVALPFRTFGTFASSLMDGGFANAEGPAFRYPTAIIKLLFAGAEMHAIRPEINSDYLFPKSDRLYQALICSQASELAIYA
jgi:hypothetical protein